MFGFPPRPWRCLAPGYAIFIRTDRRRYGTKSKLTDKPDSTIIAKKRYLIGKKLHTNARCQTFEVQEQLKANI